MPYFEDDDIEIDDEPCPSCGCDHTWRRDCWNCGGAGFFELFDDDPLWYDEDEIETCHICNGRGLLHWCRECGANVPAKPQVSGDVTL